MARIDPRTVCPECGQPIELHDDGECPGAWMDEVPEDTHGENTVWTDPEVLKFFREEGEERAKIFGDQARLPDPPG